MDSLYGLSNLGLQGQLLSDYAPNKQPVMFRSYLPQQANQANGGFFSGMFGNNGSLAKLGNFFNGSAGKGLMGLAGLGTTIYDMYNQNKMFKEAKKNMALQREAYRYNIDRQKAENNRLDRQRQAITQSYNNGSVI